MSGAPQMPGLSGSVPDRGPDGLVRIALEKPFRDGTVERYALVKMAQQQVRYYEQLTITLTSAVEGSAVMGELGAG